MGEELSMDNILTGDEAANLFLDMDTETKELPQDTETEEKENKNNETTEVDPEHLFDEEDVEKPESVGSGKDKESKEKKDTTSEEDTSTSPNDNFYSSIASALKGDGIFPDLDDEDISKVKEPEDLREIIEKLILAGVEEINKRVYDALNSGVEPNVIKLYENTLSILNKITEELITDESDLGETLRRNLLEQDFRNRGYSNERAATMAQRLFASGEDIEEAKLALLSNKEYFSSKYSSLLDDAKKLQDIERENLKKLAEELKKDILTSEKIFGDISLDKNTRLKVYENISKPVYKDPNTGKYFTALLKYRMENENEYIKNVGLIFTLTDGFKNLDKIVKPAAKREVKSQLRELEKKLRGNSNNNGNLKFVGSASKELNNSFLDSGFAIDIN